MSPNSRDNVNPEATITMECIDRKGDVLDRHVYHGRHEPSTMFMDFQYNCFANFGKAGDKIVRFTCEIAYILLVGLFFLSSGAAEASRGDTRTTLRNHASIILSGYNTLFPPIPLVRPARAPHTFPEQAAPILYVIDWPPVKSQAARLAETAYERLIPLMEVKSMEVLPFDWHEFWKFTMYSAIGLGALLCGLVWLIFRSET